MLQLSTLKNNAKIIWLLSALLFLDWMSICCTGASVTVLVMELSMLVVILETTAKNSNRLKHCIEVWDTTHQLFELSLQHSTFFYVEGRSSLISHHQSVIVSCVINRAIKVQIFGNFI
jgi:hypothetical protein